MSAFLSTGSLSPLAVAIRTFGQGAVVSSCRSGIIANSLEEIVVIAQPLSLAALTVMPEAGAIPIVQEIHCIRTLLTVIPLYLPKLVRSRQISLSVPGGKALKPSILVTFCGAA